MPKYAKEGWKRGEGVGESVKILKIWINEINKTDTIGNNVKIITKRNCCHKKSYELILNSLTIKILPTSKQQMETWGLDKTLPTLFFKILDWERQMQES